MYLSQLDIIGFKSFAQKTKLKFNRGISAIVGPNGCGKTNVVDAIRWVLGEQKSAVLRSEVMDNVIFNGTKTRKPLSMAEVSLLIINDRGVLPSDYNEILITRRIFKDGETEYLINNAKCRLKDILELFMDTGMSSNSYSVIELKMVEAILSGRPEERRQLIEEAAGVNKYKQRRKETTRKLQNIQFDLQRINDLVAVIDKNVASLMRQASKTKRYNKFMETHKELESAIIIYDYRNLKDEKSKYEIELKNKNSEKIALNNSLQEIQSDYDKLLIIIDQGNLKIQEIKEKEVNINSIISNLNKELAINTEKITFTNNDLTKNNNNKEEFKIKLESLKKREIDLDNLLKNSEIEFTEILNNLDRLSTNKNNSKESFNEIKDKIQVVNNSLNSIKNNVVNLNNNLNKNIYREKNLTVTIENINNDIENAKNNILNIEDDVIKFKSKLEESNLVLKEKQNNLTEAKAIKDNIKSKIETLKQEINENQNLLSSKNASLAYLKSLSDKDENTNFLLDNKNWDLKYEKNILIESIFTEEKFRIAIESIIGELKNSFIINNNDDAIPAIESLINAKKGKTNFIIKNANYNNNDLKIISLNDNIFGYAIDLIKADDYINAFLKYHFNDAIVVDNLETAQNLIYNNVTSKAVTLTGEILTKYGYLKSGGVLNNEGQIVGKNERIKKLNKEITSHNEELNNQKNLFNELNIQFNEINVNKIINEISIIEKNIQDTNNSINQVNNRKIAIAQNIEAFEKSLIRYKDEKNEILKENEDLNKSIQSYENQKIQNEEELNSLKIEYNLKETTLKNDENEYYQAELNKIKFEANTRSMKEEKNRNSIESISISDKIKSYDNDNIMLNNNIISLNIKLKELEDNIKERQLDSQNFQSELIQENSKLNELNNDANQIKNEIIIHRQNLEKNSDIIHKIELGLNETNTNIKNLFKRAIDLLNLENENENEIIPDNFDLDNYITNPIEINSIQEAKNDLKEIKEKLNQLGSVNFLALQQYEEEFEKQSFYKKQLNDLLESEKTLKETIDEINDIAENKFKSTFDLVNNNFQMLFKKLFSEEADSKLELIGENLLESDIEIIARPPGKKPHSIDMLSQGEKTLTAIALLFGIYLVKPSPFCILDEVDAPLDDNNIDRFLGMIKQFSDDTQFLMVTHNKSTMTAADTLYGVTMQEDGVSKVVSVKFDKSEIPLN